MADPEQAVAELTLLTEEECAQIVEEWNATEAEYSERSCAHKLIEEQALCRPEAVAVVMGEQELTYAELNGGANQLARCLREHGVGREVAVGLYVERSLEMVVGMLGILKAGGAYVPIDPGYPPERVGYVLQDTAAPVVLTQKKLSERLPPTAAKALCLDSGWDGISRYSSKNPRWKNNAEDLAYIIYTSGSTGRPKGVLIAHRALVNHCTAFINRHSLRPTDRVLQFAAPFFDVAAEEIFPSLAAGAILVLRSDDVAFSFQALLEIIGEKKLTVLNLPTPYWHEWVLYLAESELRLPATLRLVIVGSDRCLPERLALWQQCVPETIAWCNAYGPTEATITAAVYFPDKNGRGEKLTSVPIGRPIANTRLYILDRRLKPVPIGVAGELHIAGVGLARGYLNQDELTAEKFIPDPFAKTPGARLYKTGDLARYRADGEIEF